MPLSSKAGGKGREKEGGKEDGAENKKRRGGEDSSEVTFSALKS